jgi:hypothetical protein
MARGELREHEQLARAPSTSGAEIRTKTLVREAFRAVRHQEPDQSLLRRPSIMRGSPARARLRKCVRANCPAGLLCQCFVGAVATPSVHALCVPSAVVAAGARCYGVPQAASTAI